MSVPSWRSAFGVLSCCKYPDCVFRSRIPLFCTEKNRPGRGYARRKPGKAFRSGRSCGKSNQLFEKELLDLGIHKLIQYSTLERGEVRDIEFDAIIDPFFDIYVTQLIDFLKYGGKYIFCGFYYQDILYKPFKQSNNDYFRVLAKCIVKNISLIGNCLGCENDLRDALNNFEKGKYDIVIDSIYTGDEIVPFFYKSLFIAYRVLGK